MKVFLAPPKGPKELVAFIDWLTHHGFEPITLQSNTPINGPLILAGGADIGKDTSRDINELRWIQEALVKKQPIIGVCRGMQILNHYFGGTVEDLDLVLEEAHAAADFSDAADHTGRPSRLHLIEDRDGNQMQVNSRHHQYCDKIADNFTKTHVGGGIVEAIEDLDRQIWAVQWHPERWESDDNLYPLDKLFAK